MYVALFKLNKIYQFINANEENFKLHFVTYLYGNFLWLTYNNMVLEMKNMNILLLQVGEWRYHGHQLQVDSMYCYLHPSYELHHVVGFYIFSQSSLEKGPFCGKNIQEPGKNMNQSEAFLIEILQEVTHTFELKV